MDLHLTNFRCYADRTFHFPLGVILIDGPSGKGKSTILQAIKYALFGSVKNVSQYGTKKTSVRLSALDLDIVRTNIPSRLVVHYQSKMVEDLEAQEMIYKRFGRQFDITSYMVQKGTSQFFTLTGAEKLSLLEELSLTGNENIPEMKASIQSEVKELRNKFMEEQAQIRLLESQVVAKPSFQKWFGIKRLSDVTELMEWNLKLNQIWESQRSDIEKKLSNLTSSMRLQKLALSQHDSLRNALLVLKEERNQLQSELDSVQINSLDELERYKKMSDEHDKASQYQLKKNELDEKKKTYDTLIANETIAIEQQRMDLESQRIAVIEDASPLRTRLAFLQQQESICVRINELQTELVEPKYIDIHKKWETSVETAEKVKKFLQESETRKCVQSCPHCKKGLVVQSQKIVMVDHQPVSESDKIKEAEYKTKYPLLQKQVENQHRLMVYVESMRTDLARLQKECEQDPESIRLEVETLQSRIKQIQAHEFTNQSIERQLKALNERSPETKYHDMKKTIVKLSEQVDHMPTGRIHDDIESIRSTIKHFEEAHRDQTRIQKRMELNRVFIAQKEAELSAIQLDSCDYPILIQETLALQAHVAEQSAIAQNALLDSKQYFNDMQAYCTYREKEKVLDEKKKRCILYQSQLEQLDALSMHIVQSEGAILEQFIRRINRTMAWYMEQFFPDLSLKMELDSEKECKNGKIRHEICVQLLQHQFPCELKALSGGEYDRCALAFMLTINELSHSPCLFLDESISSLDMTLSEDVLEVIKEKQTELRKFVLLVSHQANTGFFDHVVSL